MTRAGKLDRRITLQSRTVTRGTSGGANKAWATVAEVWAAVRDMSGNERAASAQGGGQVAEARTEFTVRWRSGVTADMRVLYQGRIYNVRHVNDLMGRRETLILTCDTGVNDG